MTTARRRALVGLLSLALIASAQAGVSTGAVAADAPTAVSSTAAVSGPASSPAAVGTAAVAFTTAPLPTVTGTAQVGATLTAATGTWAPQPDAFAFTWKRGTTAITGATGSAYTVVAADLGKRITVTATASKAGYTSLAKTSAATATVIAAPRPVAFTTIPTPTISGTPKVGAPLTAVPGTWAPAPTTLTYRWSVASVPVAGETGPTFTPRAVDVRKRITVTVTGTRAGYTTASKTSLASAVVLAANATTPFTTIPTPTLSGTAKVGATLTAAPGAWTPAPSAFAYKWSANGIAVAGETGATYVVRAADLRKRITVTVTGTLPGYTTASKTSLASAAVVAAPVAPPATFTTIPTPTLSGTAEVGATLTAAPGAWAPAPSSFAYRWWSDGIAITGETAATYAVRPADLGRRITVTVTGALAGYTTAAKTSAATAVVVASSVAQPFAIASTPTIGGSAAVGSVLTAATGSWSPVPAFAYQWSAGTVPIAGATGPTYTVGAAELGSTITVTITATADGRITTTRTSAATAPVGDRAMQSTAPQIVGDAQVGVRLRVVPGLWTPRPAFTYTWFADDVAIAEATEDEYRPTTDDLGKRITATVVGSADGYVSLARTSAATAAVVAEDVQLPEEVPNAQVTGSVYSESVGPATRITEGYVELTDPDFGWEVASTQIVDGVFAFPGLHSGEYSLRAFVEVAGEQIEQYYGPAVSHRDAQTFAVQADGSIQVDMVVRRAATISGTVTAADGSPVADAQVVVSGATEDDWLGGAASTDAAGRFAVRGLDPGSYRVRVSAPSPNPSGLQGEWYGGGQVEDTATVVTLAAWGQTATGIDVVLDAGARMQGTVRDTGGRAIADANVYLVPLSDAVPGSAPVNGLDTRTDASGAFDITGIAPGDYKLFVSASRESAPTYVAQWVGGTGTVATATVYRAVLGTRMSSPAVQLAVDPSVTTRVTGLAAAGWDADRALVRLHQGGVLKHSAYAWDADGAFMRGVAPGTYRVSVTYYRGSESRTYWWGGGVNADRSEVVVRAGESVAIVAPAVARVAPAGAQLVR